MKLLFIDLSPREYDCRTMLHEPLGGTQTAVAMLSLALADRGYNVTVINSVSAPRTVDGINFLPSSSQVKLNDYDFIIPVSCALGEYIKKNGCEKPIILWTHHDANQPSVQSLGFEREKSCYAGFAFVSNWQAMRYHEAFAIDGSKSKVLGNAVSVAAPFSYKEPYSFAYTSTPYRGLDVLLLAWPYIRKHIPQATLRVFSSMAIYGCEPDPYDCLYELARALPGVEYMGAVSQMRLATEMAKTENWAYPCTFAETSCIAAMEANYAGCRIMTTDLGALKETLGDYASYIDPLMDIMPICAKKFADFVIENIEKPVVAGVVPTWAQRAEEWETWLNAL